MRHQGEMGLEDLFWLLGSLCGLVVASSHPAVVALARAQGFDSPPLVVFATSSGPSSQTPKSENVHIFVNCGQP